MTWVSNPSSFSSSHCLGKRWTLSYLRDKTLASQMDRNPFLLMPTAIIIHKDSGIKEFGVSLSLFRHMAFRKVTFQQKQFGTIDILARVPLFPRTFRHMDILSLWTFQHRDILAPWTGIHYGTGTFRHRGQNVLVLKQPYCCAWSQNILVPKWPSAQRCVLPVYFPVD